MSNAETQARHIMEAVGILHSRGYGLLKLVSYIKEGLGQWRYFLFAGDAFPYNIGSWPGPRIWGSIPSFHRLDGDTSAEVAAFIEEQGVNLLSAAKGSDPIYVNWYAEILQRHPLDVLLMESPDRARMLHHGWIPVPPLKRWTAPNPTPEERLAAEKAERDRIMQRAIERRSRRNK